MRYGFARVSSQEQAIGGMSIDVQVDRLKALGIDKKFIFVDAGKSAGVKEDMVEYQFDGRHFNVRIDLNNRPEFKRMMAVLTPLDELYFLRFDRISRNFHFLESFIKWCDRKGVILKPLDDSTHKLTRRILSVIAQEELEKTAIRNDDIFKGIYERGGMPFKASYAYIKNTKDDKGRLKYPDLPESSLIIDPAKAEIVKECFKVAIESKRTNNKTLYRKLCTKYDLEPSMYYSIIKNKIYCGMTHYGKEWKKSNQIPQIITEEEWQEANIKSGHPQNIKGQSNTQ